MKILKITDVSKALQSRPTRILTALYLFKMQTSSNYCVFNKYKLPLDAILRQGKIFQRHKRRNISSQNRIHSWWRPISGQTTQQSSSGHMLKRSRRLCWALIDIFEMTIIVTGMQQIKQNTKKMKNYTHWIYRPMVVVLFLTFK